jgi:ADP-heptose:LPS heptosyltransferase
MSSSLVLDVAKIAVLRANAIGDLIFTFPALEALRAAYPAAEIVLLGMAWHRDFLTARPGPVDRVEVIPTIAGVGATRDEREDYAEINAFLARMNEERFDLALQLHGGGRFSNSIVNRLGAGITVGFRTDDAEPLGRWIPYVYRQLEVLRFLEVVRLVGATPVVLTPRIAVTEADLHASRLIVPERERPLVALNPGAGDPERRWPPENFAEVGDALVDAGADIVITGADWDSPIARIIVERMRHPAQDTTGQLHLGGLAGLLSRCSLVVSNDSGPLHLAAAVGTATVGIYWCFNLVNAGPLETARHRPVVSWRQHCPICHIDRARFSCDHHPSFVADISPDEVITTARELFATTPNLRLTPSHRSIAPI